MSVRVRYIVLAVFTVLTVTVIDNSAKGMHLHCTHRIAFSFSSIVLLHVTPPPRFFQPVQIREDERDAGAVQQPVSEPSGHGEARAGLVHELDHRHEERLGCYLQENIVRLIPILRVCCIFTV